MLLPSCPHFNSCVIDVIAAAAAGRRSVQPALLILCHSPHLSAGTALRALLKRRRASMPDPASSSACRHHKTSGGHCMVDRNIITHQAHQGTMMQNGLAE
eukprot:GHRR01033723.1.p1 GENE.GHRR01033723.1~~GHRR01033723.1.p1  ORF type:complete len:100 (+),score=22.43 GHRR01033723.1:556-855(+)